jgi:hypothetical protein
MIYMTVAIAIMVWLLCGAVGTFILVKADEKIVREKRNEMKYLPRGNQLQITISYGLGLIILIGSIWAMSDIARSN